MLKNGKWPIIYNAFIMPHSRESDADNNILAMKVPIATDLLEADATLVNSSRALFSAKLFESYGGSDFVNY